MRLQGKTAIVTGASRGIGKQVAIELGRLGANVIVAARTVEQRRSPPGTTGETVAMIDAADMASEADLERLVSGTVERFGGSTCW